jgi:predicted secreted Zn-dependent protease
MSRKHNSTITKRFTDLIQTLSKNKRTFDKRVSDSRGNRVTLMVVMDVNPPEMI